MRLLLLGPQGSGKGTQARRIADEREIPHISTGEMFRAAIAAETELGRQVEPILAAGLLVPDGVTVALIRERLSWPDARRGFVLDGFPRNLVQAEVLDAMLDEVGQPLDAVLFLDVADEVSLERLGRRAIIEDRDDDTPEAIGLRLAIYHEETAPVVDHYRATGRLIPLHGERSIDEVATEIADALDLLEDEAA